MAPNYNVAPQDITAAGHAPTYVDLAIRQAELTRTIYVLQAAYSRHTRDLTAHLTHSPPPAINGAQQARGSAQPTYQEHALVIRQVSDELRSLADEIAAYDGELTKVRAELLALAEEGTE